MPPTVLTILPKQTNKPSTSTTNLPNQKNKPATVKTKLTGEKKKNRKNSRPKKKEIKGQTEKTPVRAFALVGFASTKNHDQTISKALIPSPFVTVTCLDHQITLVGIFAELYLHRNVGDVFIICGETYDVLRAHRFVLCCGSAFFRDVLKVVQCEHPVIALKNVSVDVFCQVLEYIYLGQVKLKQESELKEFFISARYLMVNGIDLDQCSLI